MHHKVFFVFVLVVAPFFSRTAWSQSLPSAIAKGRIITTDGTAIPFQNLTTGTEIHRYQPSPGGAFVEFPADKTIKLEEQRGTKVWEKSGYWGGFMLGTALVAAQISKKKYPDAKSNTTPIVLGATAGGLLIGALIGLAQKNYVEVYSNPKYNTGFHLSRLQMQIAFHNRSTNFGFQYRL